MKMESSDLSDLEAFAKERIAAQRYPNDLHPCRVAACEKCGVAPFELTIEHEGGSKPGRFKGVTWVWCSRCGSVLRPGMRAHRGVGRRALFL